jgi:FHS family L-fucose permease-like MFS transporter
MLFLTLFFESVCFPTIVALGIRGLGKHYKRGSGLIVAGVSGGAVVPPILVHVADMRNSTGFAMIVPTMVRFSPSYTDT